MIYHEPFHFEANSHHDLPILALDADDTTCDTRGWFTGLAVANGADRKKCLACPTLSLTTDLLPQPLQNSALESATFMKEAKLLPGAAYLFGALAFIEYPHFVFTHRGYHPKGQEFTQEFFDNALSGPSRHVIALDTTVSKHEFLENLFTHNGRGNYLLCDDNTHCRRPDGQSTIVHDRWSRTIVVAQPWNGYVEFGATRVIQVESILRALLQELHVYAEVRGSKRAKAMYKKLWHYIRTSPYECVNAHELEVREHRRLTLTQNPPVGVDVQ